MMPKGEWIEGVSHYDTDLRRSFFGYRIETSYELDKTCTKSLSTYQGENFMDAIDNQFGFKLYLDGLPSAVVVRDPVTGEVHNEYDDGIPVGKIVYDKDGKKKYVLYNHWILTVKT